MSDANKVVVFIHPRGGKYFPSLNRLYGSDFGKISLHEERDTGFEQYFQMHRTDWEALDQPTAPCDEENG